MGIYDSFNSKEELLAAVDKIIEEESTDDGKATFRIVNTEAETLRAKWQAEIENAKKQRAEKQRLGAELNALQGEYNSQKEAFEQLRALKPDEMKAKLDSYLLEVGGYKKTIAEYESEIVPLRERIGQYEARERRDKIESELVACAKRLDVADAALRDVRRLAPMFKIREDGIVCDSDGRLVAEVLEAELQESPHWLKRSQGAGAGAATPTGPKNRESLYADAKARGDMAAMLAFAPRIE